MSVLESISRDLKIPLYAIVRRRELELYAEQLGEDALVRQVTLGKTRHRCCWESVAGPHHSLCAGGRPNRRAESVGP